MPVALDLIAILAAFCVFLIAWLLLQGYRNTFGLLLGKIAEETAGLSIAGVHPFGWLASGLDRINHFILYQLGQVVQGSAWAWHKLISQTAAFVHESMSLVADLAEATAGELERIGSKVIPAAISTALGPVVGLAISLRKQIAHLFAQVAHLATTTTHTVTHEITKQTVRVEKTIQVRTKTIVVASAGAVAGVLPRLGRVERDLHGIDKRLEGVLRRVAPAAILGVVAASLAKLGLHWARCSRTQKWDKAVCGMDDSFLEGLLADALLVFSTISIVELARESQSFVADVTAPLAVFVRELHNLPVVGGVKASAALADYAAGRF